MRNINVRFKPRTSFALHGLNVKPAFVVQVLENQKDVEESIVLALIVKRIGQLFCLFASTENFYKMLIVFLHHSPRRTHRDAGHEALVHFTLYKNWRSSLVISTVLCFREVISHFDPGLNLTQVANQQLESLAHDVLVRDVQL